MVSAFDSANGFPQASLRVGSAGMSASAMAWVGGELTVQSDVFDTEAHNWDKRA